MERVFASPLKEAGLHETRLMRPARKRIVGRVGRSIWLIERFGKK
jgi:hypothetical protein